LVYEVIEWSLKFLTSTKGLKLVSRTDRVRY